MSLLTAITLQIKSAIKRKRALPLIALLGLLLMILIINLKPKLTHQPAKNLATAVNYIVATKQQIRPEIIGYGTVKPDISLQAKAEVSGRIVYIHPRLKKGEMLAKDTLLLKIDNKDYLLQLKQAEADLLVNQANLTEIKLTIENNELELTLALEKLKVSKTEYNRLAKLRKTGVVSQASLNVEKQKLLQQKQEVLQLKNKQTTLPSTLAVTKAQLAISQAKLEKSQRDLERTNIFMPFDGRISQVYTELDQYVGAGLSSGQLFDAFSITKVTINAQFSIAQFSVFAKNFNRQFLKADENNKPTNMAKALANLHLSAVVSEPSGNFKPWSAKVERFSDNLDSKSRTVGVIVSVSDSYKKVIPGIRPPLLEGMYTKVALLGAPLTTTVLPRFALHGEQIYIIDKNNQLQRFTLKNKQLRSELVLTNDLDDGDKIITSDIFPAVNGMTLTPILDQSAAKQMKLWLGAAQ
jgi:multidrug efflux pump subunit AcrA (membrane-fusion protein)